MNKSKHGGSRQGAGRKAKDSAKGTKRYNVSLDPETRDKAQQLGDGNLSLGIRRAVKCAIERITCRP